MIKFWFKSIFRVDSIYKANLNNTYGNTAVDKIVVNMYLGSVINNPKTILYLLTSSNLITNQMPTVIKAKKSVSSLNVRKDMILGTRLTLRKEIAFNFLNLLISIILPNDKENKLFKINNRGCVMLRLENLFSFPQINLFYDKFPKHINADVNVVPSKKNKQLGTLLYSALLIPLEENLIKA
jgi:large subunit ribosomal protein L5